MNIMCIVNIDENVYSTDYEVVNTLIDILGNSKKGSYSIFCVELNGVYYFVNENYESESELESNVANYSSEKFNVYFINGGEEICKSQIKYNR